MDSGKLLTLCPREAISLDASQLVDADGAILLVAEDAVEDMVVCLAAVAGLAERTGLPDVAQVAVQASALAAGGDDVALAAVVARLVRVGELSLATLLEISYRQH